MSNQDELCSQTELSITLKNKKGLLPLKVEKWVMRMNKKSIRLSHTKMEI